MSDRPIRVLLIEDNPGDARLIREMLAEGADAKFILETADCFSAGLTRLAQGDIAVVLLDLALPDSQGADTFARMHAHAPRVPVVVLTGLEDETLGIALVESGAQDYLVKGQVTVPLLARAIRYAIERQRAEEALRESEERYRTLIEQASDGIFLADGEGRYIEVNSAGCRLLGYTREEILQKTIRELTKIVPTQPLQLDELRQGKTLLTEREMIRKDGTLVSVEISAKQLPDGRLQGIVRDITERKRAEQALKASEERFRALTENATDLIIVLNPDGTGGYISPSVERILGFHSDELVGTSIAGFIHPDDLPAALEAVAYRQQNPGLADQTSEFRVRHKDGFYRMMEVIGNNLLDNPAVNGIVVNARDITERKQAGGWEQLARQVLDKLNRPEGATDTVNDILLLVKENTGIEAVGIRLREGDDFPYYETIGFPVDFVHAERYLCAHDEAGKIVRDGVGNPVLECMCGNVLCGRTNARLPFFTENGSFWTNSTTKLLASTSEEDRQARTRNRCNGEGYESVALIPLLSGREIIGLLQLNDRQPNRFTPEMIRFFEGLGSSIGITLLRRQAEENLRASEAKLRATFAAMQDVIIVYDSEGRYLEIAPTNPSNLYRPPADMLGKTVTEVLPPEQADYILEQIQRTLEKGEVTSAEYCLRLAENDVWFAALVSPLAANSVVWVAHNITNRKQAETALLRQLQELTLLHAVAIHASAAESEDALIEQVTAMIGQTFYPDNFGFLLLDDAAGALRPHRSYRGAAGSLSVTIRLGEGVTGRVAQDGKVRRIADVRKEKKYIEVFPEARSELCVPLKIGKRVIGVINAESHEVNAFSEADERLLNTLAGQAATAIEHLRARNAERRRLTELEAVNKISTALRAAQTVDEMLPILLDETLAVINTEAGSIYLYDAERDEIRKMVARGWYEQMPAERMKPNPMPAQVLASGQLYLTREFAADPLPENIRSYLPAGWGGACLPLRAAQETIGLLFVAVQLPRQLSVDEIHLLTTLAEIAGNAIRRASLNEQTQRQVQRLASLRSIDMAISSVLDLRLTLDILLDHILTQLGVDAANILLYNSQTQTLEYGSGRGFRSKAQTQLRLRLGESQAGRAALERRMVAIPDIQSSEVVFSKSHLLADESFSAYYAVPLITKGQIKGVLEIFHRSTLNPDAEWLNFLETLAGQAAIALDNAALFEGLQRSNLDLALAYDTTLEGWAKALELRDKETQGHTQRVTELALQLARAMGVRDAEVNHLRRGALLHDIGKMGVPDDILRKPGPLTDEEWVIMRQHPQFAVEMLSPIAYLRQSLDIPAGHHEKWDGSGYPRGLKGEQIPLAARIFAVVDVWDALLSDRPYRKAWSQDRTTKYIREQAGKHFDPQVAEAFLLITGDKIS